MYISDVKIENFRGIGKETTFKFNPGITVLVGENDSGKSTVIDAIRYVLGTTDQNWYKVEISDYHNEDTGDEIRISIGFSDLSLKEKAAFMECLTYTKTGEKLYLNWTAKYMKNVKPNRTLVNLTCGKNGDVSAPSPEARELLRVTYLKPLRDATLLVAKLAILAKKWNEEGRGICVLSHTNVAREEIQERLGTSDIGKKLLSYPHFIGTFQSFIDTFISIPILRSCGIPVNIVDTEFVTERRWNSIYTKGWLERNGKDKKVCDPVKLPCEFNVSCSKTSPTYIVIVRHLYGIDSKSMANLRH